MGVLSRRRRPTITREAGHGCEFIRRLREQGNSNDERRALTIARTLRHNRSAVCFNDVMHN